jgi:hypothetical protein
MIDFSPPMFRFAPIVGLRHGAVSCRKIAEREGKVERHIRLLAPLAFVSPRLLSEIIDGVIT